MANKWFEKGHYLVLHSCILHIVGAKRERESNCCQVGLRPVRDCRDQTRPKHGSMNHSFIHFLGLQQNEGQQPINPSHASSPLIHLVLEIY